LDLVGAGLGDVAVDGLQRLLVLVEPVLHRGQVEHHGVVVVVVQAVGGERVLEEGHGPGVVVVGAGGVAGEQPGEGLLVGVGVGIGADLLGQRNGGRVVFLLERVLDLAQLLDPVAGRLGLGLLAGGLGVQLLLLLGLAGVG